MRNEEHRQVVFMTDGARGSRGMRSAAGWETELPEVPVSVHTAILEALEQIGETDAPRAQDRRAGVTGSCIRTDRDMEGGDYMRETTVNIKNHRAAGKSRFTGKKAAALAAAMTAVLGMSVLVAAAELWWNQKAAEEFGNPAPEMQEQMVESGVAEMQTVSATDAGITVTAVQTLRDANRIYMLFEITSEEAVIDGNSGFAGWKMITDEGLDLTDYERALSGSGGMTMDTPDGSLTTQGFYFWDILMSGDEASGWNGDTLTVQFADFDYYTYENGGEGTAHTVTGNWELTLHLTDTTELARTFTPEKTVTAAGVPVRLNSVTVTPLTVTLHYALDDVKKAGETFDEEDYVLSELYVTGFVGGDGNRSEGIGATTGAYTEDEMVLTIGMESPMDVDDVKSLILAGGDEIVLR